MDVAVVGAGRVGMAMAVALRSAGHDLVAVSGRAATAVRAARYLPGVPVVSPPAAARSASVVILSVPADALASVVEAIAAQHGFNDGAWAVHVDGAATLGVLDPAAEAGAHRLAVHPLQTFPAVDGAVKRLDGAGMAVTADDEPSLEFGMALARDLGGVPFELDEEARPLYHAAAVFASNYVVAVSAVAASLFEAAGVADPGAAMAPLQRATLENIERMGLGSALTGPAVRGDATTIERNLEALREVRPELVASYVALCRIALQLGLDSERLPSGAAVAVSEVLDTWM